MTHSRILVVNGSYREDGITDRAVAAASEALRELGAEIDTINLRDYPIEFCTNCRQCALEPGSEPGRCVIDDGMHGLIDRIEASNAFILAAPTNFYSVTAIFKRFMERLMPYAYWPWEKPWPVLRRTGRAGKKALLISSSAAPAWLGSWLYGSNRQLARAAKVIGARPVGSLFTGLAAKSQDQDLPSGSVDRARRLARRLIED